jgi:hypothetical protein
MKIHQIFRGICLVLLASCLIAVTNAITYEDPITGTYYTGKVYVSSTSFDPGAFFDGDKGTVTYVVANGNTNTSVRLTHGTFYENHFRKLNEDYDSTTTLGPMQTRPFSFSIVADGPEGDYFPTFTVNFFDSNLNYKTLLQIDNTPLVLTVVDKPDAFAQGKKKTLYLQVANPRKNNVRNVILEASGAGITASPSKTYVGDLAAGAKVPVNISVTPDQETTLNLLLSYQNGVNPHEVTMDIPLTFGDDKKQADPIMSNVIVTNEGTLYRVTGDVNNAGLETANTVTVTSLSPAVPQDPYKTYVVGALKPDDFGSFEITFSTDTQETSIPVQLAFKDTDGNIYTKVQNVTVPENGLAKKTDAGPPLVPIIAALVLVALFVGGWFFYLRKKKQ